MAKKESSNPKSVPTFQAPRNRSKWFWAVLCFVVAVLLLVSFIDYRAEQSSQITTTPTDTNLVGLFGSDVSYYSFSLIGISSWLVPLFLFWTSWILVRRVKRVALSRITAMIVCIIAACGLASMPKNLVDRSIYPQDAGGMVGDLIYNRLLADLLGTFGSFTIFLAAYGMAWFFVFTRDFGAQVDEIHAQGEAEVSLGGRTFTIQKQFVEDLSATSLADRISQASTLLATRVGIERERQNQLLLASMDKRAKLQLRLQEAVEGLSLAAILYYVAGLIGYGAKAVHSLGVHVNPDLVVGLSIPVVGVFLLLARRRFLRRMESEGH